MSNNIISINYIYLLQEREFIKTKENIYKVGMSQKENHKRFNQYPKGSILLFQMICNNCKNIEKCLIKIFKDNFKLRNDIGNEYFEGDYKSMIDIIYSTIKNEKEEYENLKEIKDEEEDIYQITTYEEWIKYNNISEIIITKKTGEGFLRFKGQLWRELYDKNRFDFDKEYMEHLLGFIENNQPDVLKMISPRNDLVSFTEKLNLIYIYINKETNEIINWEIFNKLDKIQQDQYNDLSKQSKYKFIGVEYNINKILQDIINKCYIKKRCDFYNLNYNEYIFKNLTKEEYVMFDSVNFIFTPVDKLINNKILTDKDSGKRCLYVTNSVNINFNCVNDILNSLITNEIKLQYKKLVYNLIVKQEEKQIIFYDYNDCLLTTWIEELLYSISGNKFYVHSHDYYENKLGFKNLLKTQKPRCVIIYKYTNISIEKQIKDLCKLGFKNIIVCQNDKTNNMYNITNFKKYLHDNSEILMKLIKEQNKQANNYEPISITWEFAIKFNDDIFYRQGLLLTNFLKWCCIDIN
jgi:hypothetical protein